MRQLLVTLVVGLLVATLGPGVADAGSAAAVGSSRGHRAASVERAGGRTYSRDHVLRRRCHSYPFRYSLNGVGDDWSASLRLIGPHGGAVASHFFQSGNESTSGRSAWRICAYPYRAGLGRYTIRLSITRYDFAGRRHMTQGRPSSFRLVAARAR